MEKEQGLKGYIRQNRAELFREIEDLIQNEDVTDIEWDGYYLWVTDLKKGCYCHNIRLNEEYVDNLAIRLANIMKVPFNRAYPILEANTEDCAYPSGMNPAVPKRVWQSVKSRQG